MTNAIDLAMEPDAPAAPAADSTPDAAEAVDTAPATAAAPTPEAPKPPPPRAHELAREALKHGKRATELEKTVAELQAKLAGQEKTIAGWKERPHDALKDFGLDYTTLTQMVAKGEAKGVPLTPADLKVAALEAQLAQAMEDVGKVTANDAERTAQAQKAADAQRETVINREAMDVVKASPERFPLLGDFGFNAVQEAESYYAETGEPAKSYDVLAMRAEARALKELEALLPRLAKNQKAVTMFQQHLTNLATDTEAPADGAPAPAPKPATNGSRQAITTKAAAAASGSRGSSSGAKLPWSNPHKSSPVDEAMR